MITEPELAGEPEPSRPADLLSDEDRRPPSAGTTRRRPWTYALGGVVAASLVWAAAIQGTGYGRTAAPDLHGFHLDPLPCTSASLEPLTDAVTPSGFLAEPPSVRKGPALENVLCTMDSSLPYGDGWVTNYLVQVTIELHRKTDPRAEFQDIYSPPLASPTVEYIDGAVALPDLGAVTMPYSGLGDMAYITSGKSRQAISVLYGGAVVAISVDAANGWGRAGEPPDDNGSPQGPHAVDISALRPVLLKTVRNVMTELSSADPSDPSAAPAAPS